MDNILMEIITYLEEQRDSYAEEYDEDFWYNNSSDKYSEFGDNEFLWWKKEAYEDMLNFVKNLKK